MSPLTAEQRALVAEHIPLVRMQVNRQLRRMSVQLRRREHEDLVQVGTLGLMRAVGRYESQRCGPFAPYAMAYIHGAVCRYLLRQMDGLALPATLALELVRQRRAAKRQADLDFAEMATDPSPQAPHARRGFDGPATPLPQFYSLETSGSSLRELACRQAREQERGQARPKARSDQPGWSMEQLHARYEQALQWAIRKVSDTSMAQIDHMALVHAVVQERLTVPEGRFRTSRRAIARRFGCSPTRVWNLETRIVRRVQRYLAGDAGLTHEAATLVCQPDPAWSSSPQATPAVAGDRAGAVDCLAVRHVLPGAVGTIG